MNATSDTVAFHHLNPTTAIGWLKALGLLRLSGKRGYWKNSCFHLEIDSVETLIQDILNYKPKPFISPWNNSSLWNKIDDWQAILQSASERYVLMREGYQEMQSVLESLDLQGQSAAQKKLVLMSELPQQICNPYWQEWADAVGLIVNAPKEVKFAHNDLLGTGGNVGATEFCTAYFKVCRELWDLETGEAAANTESFIRASVMGQSLPKTLISSALLGHIFPAADYYNDLGPGSSAADYQDNGTSSQLANPIDLILYLEGATTFTGKSIPRKKIQQEEEYNFAAYPLILEVNSGSADTSDRTGRAYEIWLPLWEDAIDWEQLQTLVTTDLSFRLKNQVVDTLDMLQLLCQRSNWQDGLSRFARFGLWKRKGKSRYLVYIGLAEPKQTDIGAELRKWRLQAQPTAKQSQSQYNLLSSIHKRIYQLQQGNKQATTLLRLLGKLEVLHGSMSSNIPPSPQLSQQWVEEAYQENPIYEVELAAAVVSAIPKSKRAGSSYVYSFRQLLSPARYSRNKDLYYWDKDNAGKLQTGSLEVFCISLLKLWQQIWQQGQEYHPAFGWTYWASQDAIAAFISGRTDDRLILELIFGFSLCKIPSTLAPSSHAAALPQAYKYAASLQWSRNTVLSMQSINGLLVGSTIPLSNQLAAIQKPAVLPATVGTGRRSALALVFPCQPFYQLGTINV